MKSPKRTAETESLDPRWNQLYQVSGAAGMLAGGLFLLALAGLIGGTILSGTSSGWFSHIENNWLVLLFKWNAGYSGVRFDQLVGPDAIDLLILALVAILFAGLYAALRQTSRVWSVVAAVQPILGLALFIITGLAGRSAVMGAGLVISFVMLRSRIFGKPTAWIGILACVLLLAGDFGSTADTQFTLLAVFIGIGYVLLTAWFFLVACRLLQIVNRQPRNSVSG
jgi:hypothetical protein